MGRTDSGKAARRIKASTRRGSSSAILGARSAAMSEPLFTPERDDRDEVIAALQVSHAECARLRAELDGDGSPSSDPLRAFGVRGCLELQTEEIARLRLALDACRQERESLRLEGMATEAQRIRDNSYLVAATDAAEARVQALEAELATHHDCVQQAQDEMIAVHDEIEAKRDGIEQQLASLSAALHGLQVEIRQGADIVLA